MKIELDERTNVGIIGTGLLGGAVAKRWLAAGWRVVAYDVDERNLDVVAGCGATPAASVQDVFNCCRRIGLALPHSGVSRQVLRDVHPATRQSIVLDMTTGDPVEMVDISRDCAVRGLIYLDTTVGGSSAQVLTGEGIVMVGGDKAALDVCRDLLECFASRIFYMGASGNGARMKLAMNLALGLNRAVLAEALTFAQACGLDPAEALRVLRSGPAYSKVMDTKGEKMLKGEFSPQARLAQHRKDVDLILEQALRHSARTPLSVLHRALLAEVEQAGYGDEDNSAVIRAFQRSPARPEPGQQPPAAPNRAQRE